MYGVLSAPVSGRLADQGHGAVVVDKLAALIQRARSLRMSPDEAEAQRQSFAYGNTKIENDLITREMVAERAEALRRASE
jgi:hypothetical protein